MTLFPIQEADLCSLENATCQDGPIPSGPVHRPDSPETGRQLQWPCSTHKTGVPPKWMTRRNIPMQGLPEDFHFEAGHLVQANGEFQTELEGQLLAREHRCCP